MLYGFISGLLFGAGVAGHALRLLQEDLDTSRKFIARSAIFIYAIGSIFCLFQIPFGLLIAMLFPVVGVIAVTVTGHKLDNFQILLGVFQMIAAILSFFMIVVIF